MILCLFNPELTMIREMTIIKNKQNGLPVKFVKNIDTLEGKSYHVNIL